MGSHLLINVDPRTLHLPPSRDTGVDMAKLQRQIARHGLSTIGMPPLIAMQASDGALVVYDGVTRATRVAKYLPGQTVTVEIADTLKTPGAWLPTVGEKLP